MSSSQSMMSGLPVLANEIYLEIASHIPSVPIPAETSLFLESRSYLEIRRSRYETLQSLSQVSRSFRGLFQHFLWQWVEVHEGRKTTLKDPRDETQSGHRTYALELDRQLEVVTVRSPHLAQYVK